MLLSEIIKKLERIKEEKWDVDIRHIEANDYPDYICVTLDENTSEYMLDFYQYPF